MDAKNNYLKRANDQAADLKAAAQALMDQLDAYPPGAITMHLANAPTMEEATCHTFVTNCPRMAQSILQLLDQAADHIGNF